MKRGKIKLSKENELVFQDGSRLELNERWARALADKLRHERKTVAAFLEEFGEWLDERWATKTCSDKLLGVVRWQDVDEHDALRTEFRTLSDLAEHELYVYLRAWIMGLVLAEHGGKAIILSDKDVIEYPSDPGPKTRPHSRRKKARDNTGPASQPQGRPGQPHP